MTTRLVAATLAVAALVGCGGTRGRATLWVTKDRGAHVVLVRHVPAGLTAMQALDRVAKITTRYGGRYVQSINGVAGSLAAHNDWFYFVNGYEADRSASEYRLHDGDIEWWDFRDWTHALRQQVVVGAFPEPFLHGWSGKRLPSRVVYVSPRDRAAARRLAAALHARATGRVDSLRTHENTLVLIHAPVGAKPIFIADQWPDDGVGDPVRFRFSGDADWLATHLTFARFRYEVGG
ncbi:MAG: DUF4430 domain-containing protein [Gaiellaceae bacterium]